MPQVEARGMEARETVCAANSARRENTASCPAALPGNLRERLWFKLGGSGLRRKSDVFSHKCSLHSP